MLRREDWLVNAKREGLEVRMKKRVTRAVHTRIRLAEASYANQQWSMDFVSDRLVDGRWFRILTVSAHITHDFVARAHL